MAIARRNGLIMTDIRFAIRQWLKSPGFTSVAVLMLALGLRRIQGLAVRLTAVDSRGRVMHECRDPSAGLPQPTKGLRQCKPGNREKSASVEQRVAPCSIASEARCAS